MALDGIVIANLVHELNETVLNTRISKIAQPETDELLFTLKGKDGQKRLLLSASASLPLIYLTGNNKPSPMTAPNFCMLLRKHIANGRITKIWQPDMERIINFEIEHLNELGDLCRKTLIVEIMGKHSNIIFCDDTGRIIDSIKHIPAQVSSVREVLPGRDYFIPKTQEKYNPLHTDLDFFRSHVCKKPMSISKAIYSTYTGISPVIANEICHRASIDGDQATDALSEDAALHLYHNFSWMMEDVTACNFSPNIIMNGKEPVEFSAFPLSIYEDSTCVDYLRSPLFWNSIMQKERIHPYPPEIRGSAKDRIQHPGAGTEKIRASEKAVKGHRKTGKIQSIRRTAHNLWLSGKGR